MVIMPRYLRSLSCSDKRTLLNLPLDMTLDSSLAASFFSATFRTLHCRWAAILFPPRQVPLRMRVRRARKPVRMRMHEPFRIIWRHTSTNYVRGLMDTILSINFCPCIPVLPVPAYQLKQTLVYVGWGRLPSLIYLWWLATCLRLRNAHKSIPEWERSKYLHHSGAWHRLQIHTTYSIAAT